MTEKPNLPKLGPSSDDFHAHGEGCSTLLLQPQVRETKSSKIAAYLAQVICSYRAPPGLLARIFDTHRYLSRNALTVLPEGVFQGRAALREL